MSPDSDYSARFFSIPLPKAGNSHIRLLRRALAQPFSGVAASRRGAIQHAFGQNRREYDRSTR
jgi:hypothetical protein